MAPLTNLKSSRCYFLELPKELRVLIYDYLLAPFIMSVDSYDKQSSKRLPSKITKRAHFTTVELGQTIHPAILRTCSIVHTEAKPSLSSISSLALRLQPWNTVPLQHQRQALDLEALKVLSNINRLRKLLVLLQSSSSTAIEDIARARTFEHYLNQGLRVQHLEVTMWNITTSDSAAMETFRLMMQAITQHISFRNCTIDYMGGWNSDEDIAAMFIYTTRSGWMIHGDAESFAKLPGDKQERIGAYFNMIREVLKGCCPLA